MLKIRLMRIGAKKKPFYRVVAVDERAKRTGGYLELLGTYNPLTEPKDIKLKQDRIDHWVKQGGQMSEGFLRIIGKAPQRPPRKPKKEKKEEQPTAVSSQPAEEVKSETDKATGEEGPETGKNSETQSDSSDSSDSSDTPSPSESSEEKSEEK